MLYYLFDYLEQQYNFPGAGVFQYLSFRSAMAIILALIISMIIGRGIIKRLRRLQVGEDIRDLGLEGQLEKKGTPTMGGIIILAAILIPILLVGKLDNVYVLLLIISTVWMGLIGFIDDYIKVFQKNKKGLAGRFKVLGQIGLGLIVGTTLYFNDDVRIRDFNPQSAAVISADTPDEEIIRAVDIKSTKTTIPFVKNNEWDYAKLLWFMGDDAAKWSWLIYIPMVIFIVTAVSNAANLTDGIDGLATGVSAIVGAALLVLAYVSGNAVVADYLNIMFIPDSGEVVVFTAAFVGACIGFLWYNAYPAQVFMGDTGSLALGGVIAALALMIRKELLIPILCGVFLVENLSVVMQVAYFKYTKRKYGVGRRIFKMSPLHHHFQKLNYHESKIVTRFWIVSILLAVVAIITLKLR
ncbi:MAG: phospho-N-acetylmuramoyl-pentapeptide-transferase [Saprospiraceae bacterium]|nr:phospho-N-acetylmuramoyl-pentapeptide-transferase [Saprospiraceae bacterium]